MIFKFIKKKESESDKLIEKWEKTGLLEGLEKEVHIRQLSFLLENQAKELLREQDNLPNVEHYALFLFPAVRKFYERFMKEKPDWIKVQIQSLPASVMFYGDPRLQHVCVTAVACNLPDYAHANPSECETESELDALIETFGKALSLFYIEKAWRFKSDWGFDEMCMMFYVPIQINGPTLKQTRHSMYRAEKNWTFLEI